MAYAYNSSNRSNRSNLPSRRDALAQVALQVPKTLESGGDGDGYVEPPVSGAGCGTVIHVDSVHIDTFNFFGGGSCGFGGNGGYNGDNGDDDDDHGGLVGVMPTRPALAKKNCDEPHNQPGPADSDFVVPPDGWILCHQSPQSYSFGTLTIAPGGFIRAVCTQLTIKAKKLVIQDTNPNTRESSANPYHIEILGDYGEPGVTGAAGSIGGRGADGRDTICKGGAQYKAYPGKPGYIGGQGGNGGTGEPGKPNKPANFYFGEIQSNGPVKIFTQSGGGGKGGAGGRGGQGGTGGNGGDAHGCNCEPYEWGESVIEICSCVHWPADGGNGGESGHGGDGGQGGPGVNGKDTYVYVKPEQESLITLFSAPAPAGDGGDPGPGGVPGQGGAGGHRYCSSGVVPKDGKKGNSGKEGTPGLPGVPGTVQGEPGTIHVIGTDTPLNPQPAQHAQSARYW